MTEQIDCIYTFTQALPARARRYWTPNTETIPALRALADQGENLPALARRITRDLHGRPSGDVPKLIRRRLLLAAGMLNDTEGDAG